MGDQNQSGGELERCRAALRELHHSVKNHLQVISSLLDLEAMRREHPEALAALERSQQRIRAIALLHQHLDREADPPGVALGEYVAGLAAAVLRGQERIRLSLDIEPVTLSLKQAAPCGLLINELLDNCVKHAFAGGRRGEVAIRGRLLPENTLELDVRDTGVGLPAQVDPRTAETLGLHLVSVLARQLRGSLEVFREGGAGFRIAFLQEA
ncbi:MAG: sensor histidine kinase [Acidobacteriota bacterium]